MSGGYPLSAELCNYFATGFTSASSTYPLVTATASNTKGAYTQLTAATTDDYCVFDVALIFTAATAGAGMGFDIAVGGAGSEKVVCNNLTASQSSTSAATFYNRYMMPVSIPSGTRVAARLQASTTSTAFTGRVMFNGMNGGLLTEGFAGTDSVGWSTATSVGATVATTTTANAKGPYAQVTAATTRDYSGFFIGYDTPGITVTNFLDIAIGGAGSEVPIVRNTPVQLNVQNTAYFYPIAIPSGTRMAARMQAPSATAQSLNVTIHGLYR